MIFLDSWVWLEYLFDGEKADEAADVIERANGPEECGLVSATVISEVAYRIRVESDASTAGEAIRGLRELEHVEIVPVVDEIAEYAAELRHEYYERGTRELSYADAIHLATAAMADGCHALYSGDPDFAGVEEIEAVVL